MTKTVVEGNYLKHPASKEMVKVYRKQGEWGSTEKVMKIRNIQRLGRLGGSDGWASDFSSGHDLTVREFRPCVELCADSSEPGAASDSVSPSLSAPSLLMLCLSLSQK